VHLPAAETQIAGSESGCISMLELPSVPTSAKNVLSMPGKQNREITRKQKGERKNAMGMGIDCT
jgi:hypothetical protein